MKLKTADYDEHQRRNREVRAAREVAECAAYGSVVAVWLRASSDMGLILACIGLQGVIGFPSAGCHRVCTCMRKDCCLNGKQQPTFGNLRYIGLSGASHQLVRPWYVQ